VTTAEPDRQATPAASSPFSAAHDPAAYGERTAEAYDELYADAFDTDAAVDVLAELTGHGTLLDLGAGTGRLLVPLAERGVRVEGIEASTAMIARLQRRAPGRTLTVHYGDFSDVDVLGPYQVIVAAVSTLFMLVDQYAQLRCFENAAARLCPGGFFVVEAFVPDPGRFDQDGRRTELRSLDDQRLHLVTSRHDPVHQQVHIEHVLAGPSGLRRYPVALRYAWPSELDLMAATAGLTVHARWGGWRRQPFTPVTTDHVTIYRRPSTAEGSPPTGAPPRPGAGRGGTI
jgi:SAM-dependent methyltransferase